MSDVPRSLGAIHPADAVSMMRPEPIRPAASAQWLFAPGCWISSRPVRATALRTCWASRNVADNQKNQWVEQQSTKTTRSNIAGRHVPVLSTSFY